MAAACLQHAVYSPSTHSSFLLEISLWPARFLSDILRPSIAIHVLLPRQVASHCSHVHFVCTRRVFQRGITMQVFAILHVVFHPLLITNDKTYSHFIRNVLRTTRDASDSAV
jgi:hypothetical protein